MVSPSTIRTTVPSSTGGVSAHAAEGAHSSATSSAIAHGTRPRCHAHGCCVNERIRWENAARSGAAGDQAADLLLEILGQARLSQEEVGAGLQRTLLDRSVAEARQNQHWDRAGPGIGLQ